MASKNKGGRPRIKHKGINKDGTARKRGSGGVRANSGRPKGSRNKTKIGADMMTLLADAGIDGYKIIQDYMNDPEVPAKDKLPYLIAYGVGKPAQHQVVETSEIKLPRITTKSDD